MVAIPQDNKPCYTIKVTVLLQNSLWVGLFERNDDTGYAVARQVFGGEPTDAELYAFVLEHFAQLKFTQPQNFNLVIKRKNFKRRQREVKREMAKATSSLPPTTHAQEVLRLDLEKNKKIKKASSKAETIARLAARFQQKQLKKKQKQRGH